MTAKPVPRYAPKGSRSPFGRSVISNGERLFAHGVDYRTQLGRRFRDVVEDIAFDLGGQDQLSTLEQALIRRAAILNALCEQEEAKAVTGDPSFNLEFLGVATDRLGRIADRLGLKRKQAPPPKTLAEIIAELK